MADGPAETAIPKPGFGGGAVGEMPRKPFEVGELCREPNTTPGEAN